MLKRISLLLALMLFGVAVDSRACESAANGQVLAQKIADLEEAWKSRNFGRVDRLQLEIGTLDPRKVDFGLLRRHLATHYDAVRSELKELKRAYDRWIKLFLPESRDFLKRAATVGATQAYSEYWNGVNAIFDETPTRRSEADLRAMVKNLQTLILQGVSAGSVPAESFIFVGGSWAAGLAHGDSDIDAGVYPRNLIEASKPLPEHLAYIRRMGTLIVDDEPESLLLWAYMGFVRCHRFVLLVSATQVELLVSPNAVNLDEQFAGFHRLKLDW